RRRWTSTSRLRSSASSSMKSDSLSSTSRRLSNASASLSRATRIPTELISREYRRRLIVCARSRWLGQGTWTMTSVEALARRRGVLAVGAVDLEATHVEQDLDIGDPGVGDDGFRARVGRRAEVLHLDRHIPGVVGPFPEREQG